MDKRVDPFIFVEKVQKAYLIRFMATLILKKKQSKNLANGYNCMDRFCNRRFECSRKVLG
jgi:hypothetical protein